MKSKKGQLDLMAPAILTLVFAAIVLVFGLIISQELRDSNAVTSGGTAYWAANDTITGLGTFADFWEIIVLTIVITIVIGLLLVVFGRSKLR